MVIIGQAQGKPTHWIQGRPIANWGGLIQSHPQIISMELKLIDIVWLSFWSWLQTINTGQALDSEEQRHGVIRNWLFQAHKSCGLFTDIFQICSEYFAVLILFIFKEYHCSKTWLCTCNFCQWPYLIATQTNAAKNSNIFRLCTFDSPSKPIFKIKGVVLHLGILPNV